MSTDLSIYVQQIKLLGLSERNALQPGGSLPTRLLRSWPMLVREADAVRE